LVKSGISIGELRKQIPFLRVLLIKEKDIEVALEKIKFPTLLILSFYMIITPFFRVIGLYML